MAQGLEPFEDGVRFRRDVIKVKRRAIFRRAGLYLSVETLAARERGLPDAAINRCSVLMAPINFQKARDAFLAEFGAANTRMLVGETIGWVSLAGSRASGTRDDIRARHLRGEGDMIEMQLLDPSIIDAKDTLSASYSRWII